MQANSRVEAVRLHQTGKLEAAKAAYSEILSANPRDFEVLHLMGVLQSQLENHGEGERMIREAIVHLPNNAIVYDNLGAAILHQGKSKEAIPFFERAIELDRNATNAYLNLGKALKMLGDSDSALTVLDRLREITPELPDVYFSLGNIYSAKKDYQSARVNLSTAVKLRPNYPEALNNLGFVLRELGEKEKAIDCLRLAIKCDPNYVEAYFNMGNALGDQGRLQEAIRFYNVATELRKDYSEAKFNRSLAKLALGEFATGWQDYKHRVIDKRGGLAFESDLPRWVGQELQGHRLLLVCEQGLGDTIQFIRYSKVLKEQYDLKLSCVSPLPLHGMIKNSVPEIDVVYKASDSNKAFDYWCYLLDLPRILNHGSEDCFPKTIPYLKSDAAKRSEWSEWVRGLGQKLIGISWQGNTNNPNDANRSFPLAAMKPLWTRRGDIAFVSLQKGRGTEQLRADAFPEIIDLGNRLDATVAFADTMALIEALDLVVTCDSAVAHLAGALGKQTWMVLGTKTDWRWMREREDTPWYPTMRVFRRQQNESWESTFELISGELSKHFKSPA